VKKSTAQRRPKRAGPRLQRRGQSAGKSRGSTSYDIAVPRFPKNRTTTVRMADNKVRFCSTEQLASLTSDGSGNATWSLVVSPVTLSARNATFNTLFELCHIQYVKFKWIPNASVATPGNIISLTDYNGAVGVFPTTLATASQREGAKRHHVWESFDHSVVWRDMIDRVTDVSTTSASSHRPDGLQYRMGIVIQGAPAATPLGYIEVSVCYVYTGLKAYESVSP